MIDAHQHYWRVARGDYGWMEDNPAVEPIRRDFGPEDLAPKRAACGIESTVLVQAAPTVAETRWLLELAEGEDSVAGVVGWVDFESEDAAGELDALAAHGKFLGVRPMIQDLPDPEWMHREDVRRTFDAVLERDLAFDALGFPVHLEPFARLFEARSTLRAVIDHGMKPRIAAREIDEWARGIERIADATPVLCKLSGLLTEAAPGDGAEELRPYVEHLVSAFGPERLMWGSDWPVLTLAGDYRGWFETARALVPAAAHGAVFEGTARAFYRLGAPA